MTETTTAAGRKWNGLEIPAPGSFTLDPAHTNVGLVAKHMMVTKVRGHFSDISGTIQVADDPARSSAEITIKTASIATGNEDRDNHLRSPDFFDVENYPDIVFRSTSISHKGGDEFVLSGDLTIRDVTKPIDLDVTYEGNGINPWGQEVAGVSARGKIDREQWGLTWNVALETGGLLVSKEIVLEIEAQAIRA